MSEPPLGPSPGWYADPTGDRALRWWDGIAWTAYQSLPSPPARPAGPGTGGSWSKHTRTLQILIGLSYLAVPVNIFTIAWANRATQGVTQCNAPLTWDQSALGIYVPLAFVALALGCVVAAVVAYLRSGNARATPVRMRLIVLALIGLFGALVSGFFAAFNVGWANVCF